MDLLYKININDAITFNCIGREELNLKPNDWCIIKCPRYEDYGQIATISRISDSIDKDSMPQIKRHANLVDQGKAHENNVRSKSFQRIAEEKIRAHDLPMNLISTHFTFDRNLIIFLFTAPGRVDFRALLKDLNNTLHLRIELRQIGPRDQAGVIGGIGSCGRPLCCATFLRHFVSINIKMAKDQGISLNSATIIGACGRLKCCVEYEHEGYKDLMKQMPPPGKHCTCSEGCGRVVERNPLAQTVRIALDDGVRVVNVPLDELNPPEEEK